MKDCKIAFQGTCDEMAREDPELYKKWCKEQTAAAEIESDVTSASDSEVFYKHDRMFIQKELSKSALWDKSGKSMSLLKSQGLHLKIISCNKIVFLLYKTFFFFLL